MLRVLRRAGSTTALRRLMAFVLGVALLAGCVEPLLADSCDGDAPRATADAALARADGAVLLTGSVVGVPADASLSSAVIADAASADGTRSDGAPEHVVHVCHCTHAHGGALSDRYALSTRTQLVAREVHSRSDRLPPSPALEPQLRPPALPHAA